MNPKELFSGLFLCKSEDELHQLIEQHPTIFEQDNWFPIGGNESNFGII